MPNFARFLRHMFYETFNVKCQLQMLYVHLLKHVSNTEYSTDARERSAASRDNSHAAKTPDPSGINRIS